MLGAVAALAVGFLFAAPANATPPVCNPYVVSTRPTQWPAINATSSYFYNCQSNTAKRDVVEAQLHDLPAHIKSILQTRGAKFYLYDTPANANQDPLFLGAFDDGQSGSTLSTGTNPRSAIVTEVSHGANPSEVLSDSMLRVTTAHEAGHHLDYIWRTVPTPSAEELTLSKRFVDLYAHDLFLLNYTWNGVTTPTPRPPCGLSGVFYMVRDPLVNGFICSGTNGTGATVQPVFLGLTNAEILQDVFPGKFSRKDATAYVEGLVSPTDSYQITFTNADLPGGSVQVSYTAAPGDDETDVRDALIAEINNHVDLQVQNIHAVATSVSSFSVIADTVKLTYFTQSSSSTSSFITLKSGEIAEFFSEKVAIRWATPLTPYNTGDGPFTRETAALDKFLQSTFSCTGTYLSSLIANSTEPSVYSAFCINALPAGYSFP